MPVFLAYFYRIEAKQQNIQRRNRERVVIDCGKAREQLLAQTQSIEMNGVRFDKLYHEIIGQLFKQNGKQRDTGIANEEVCKRGKAIIEESVNQKELKVICHDEIRACQKCQNQVMGVNAMVRMLA